MEHYADARVLETEAPDHQQQAARPAGTVLGSYASQDGRRYLRAVTTGEGDLCLIDEGGEGVLLVEPGLEGIAEARALAADYLSLASERGEPQTRHPWPPKSASDERGRS